MSVATRNPEGRYEIVFERDGIGARLLFLIDAVVGISLALAPIFLTPLTTTDAIAGIVLLEIILAAAALKLVAEGSRALRIATSLHVASG